LIGPGGGGGGGGFSLTYTAWYMEKASRVIHIKEPLLGLCIDASPVQRKPTTGDFDTMPDSFFDGWNSFTTVG
jgi:hypothetical protein